MKTEIHVYGADPYRVEADIRGITDLPKDGVSVYRTAFGALVYLDTEIDDSLLLSIHEVLRNNVYKNAFPDLPPPTLPEPDPSITPSDAQELPPLVDPIEPIIGGLK